MTVAQCVQQTAAPSLNVMKPVSDQMNKLVHCRCRSYGLLQAALRKSYTLQLGDLKVKKMVQDKSMAEANVNILLQQFHGHVQQKLDLCRQRQNQQQHIHTSLTTASKYLMYTNSAPAALGWSADQAMQQNTTQLQMYAGLAASFQETQQARERLQQCIQKEEQLMSELAKPLPTCLRASIQVLQETHANMHVDFEGQEQKHAENLTRYAQVKLPCELQPMYIKVLLQNLVLHKCHASCSNQSHVC